jgi:hypothetical protein
MADASWNPWKITAIGMALVMATALVTGLVVANWTAPSTVDKPPVTETRDTSDSRPAAASRSAAPARPRVAQAPAAPVRTAAQPRVPSQALIDECNREAAKATTKDKTIEVVKDAAIGAALGAAVGAAGGAIADGGKGAGKGAAIGGVVGAGGGTLYGLNENRKQDERSREAYGACMRARGYAS